MLIWSDHDFVVAKVVEIRVMIKNRIFKNIVIFKVLHSNVRREVNLV